jgi:hypothetical protein
MSLSIFATERQIFSAGERIIEPMPDFAIFDVVDLVEVPDAQKFHAVLDILTLSWDFPRRGGSLNDNLENFRRVAGLCAELVCELEELNMGSRFHFKLHSGEQYVSYNDYLHATRSLKEQAEAVGRRKRPRHRPSGSIKSQNLRHLICKLYAAAGKTNSKLTLGRDVHLRATGTLPAIIKSFSKYIPSISEQISHKTLFRERKYALGERERRTQRGKRDVASSVIRRDKK